MIQPSCSSSLSGSSSIGCASRKTRSSGSTSCSRGFPGDPPNHRWKVTWVAKRTQVCPLRVSQPYTLIPFYEYVACQRLGKLSYFTNLNCCGHLGLISLLKSDHFQWGRSEVVIKFTQICCMSKMPPRLRRSFWSLNILRKGFSSSLCQILRAWTLLRVTW